MSTLAHPHLNFDRIDRRTKQVTPALINAVRDRIGQHLQPQKIVLFGSQATGNSKPGSDIDLLIVLGDDHSLASLKRRERLGKLLDLFRYRSFGLDAFVLTVSEVHELQEKNEGEWDLILDILATGKVIYDRTEKERSERAHSLADERVVPQSRT
jgi:predicted nucleotidyltransferase